MRADTRLSLATVVAMGLATLTVLPLTSDRLFVPVTWLGTALVCAVGLVLRRRGAGTSLAFAAQLLGVVVGSLVVAYAVSQDADLVTAYPRLWARGVLHMQTQSSPMDPDPGVFLIFVTAICLVAALADLVVSGLDRPAWAVAPLAALFAVPALGLGFDSGILSFACLALGYLAVLVADALNRATAWNQGLSTDSSRGASFRTGGTGTRTSSTAGPAVWRAAGLLAAPALVLALVLAVLLPTISLPGLGLGSGFGGNGPLQLTDPSLDLKRNLNQPANRVVFRYTSDRPGGVYLRMAALPQFSAAGFGNTQIRLNTGSTLSEPPGYSGGVPQVRTTKITSVDFSSQYLPAPYAARSFTASGDWSFNAESLTIVNSDNRADLLTNLSYEVRSWDIAPTAAELARAGAGAPSDGDVTGLVPPDLPPELVDLSRQVTRGADTPYARAVAIQTYLRDPDNFTYDIQQRPGNGYQALVNFLTVDKRGYCEQFASAMAMMARVNGIPSRVAVGFLPGSPSGDTYNVSVRDMHAWPELYFTGYGWVRFEPTPSVQTGSAPAWTVPTNDDATPSASAQPSTARSTAAPSAAEAPSTAPQGVPAETTTTTTSFSWRTAGVVAGAVVLLLLLAAPAALRVRRRRTRLAGAGPTDEQVEAAWAELRDTVLDFGGTWPSGTPRAVGREVGSRLEPSDREDLGRVATLVERARYAPSLGDPAEARDLPATTTSLRQALGAPAGPGRRLRAFLVPASLFRRG
ncbi:MAG: transglutaminase TgpA family protein [Janthinobacterium lividum]